ncbi:S8 family serine peptidase [Dactylosporangium sp. CA-092794]|uniref:S8 family serine peptidase n=1 Tax=Dactylosporangium sp. CA-092794 TaxID=3239929 RepID=UPI003D9119DA
MTPKISPSRGGALLLGGALAVLATAVAPGVAAAAPGNDAAPGYNRSQGRDASPGHRGNPRWRYDTTASTTVAEAASAVGADRLWADGVTGRNVGVALVDTGVVPVDGLRGTNVVNGPDLSVESQSDALRHLDTYGHGTHLAGIIAGNDSRTGFRGIAPDATLTSVKVGAANGASDVSQVIAAIDWVVEHRNDDPRRPIRVLNLSYGTDGVQSYQIDPLTHAVENAWRAGIVVVVAAGNGGTDRPALNNPATDPYVIAVGAADTAGTANTADDTVADFSSAGTASRRVDLVAPGRSIVSLRDPGSYADTESPDARVGDRLFKGSGTSQSAAVVSGAAALLLQQRPELTPDQVKALLVGTARQLPKAGPAAGAGELNLGQAARAKRPAAVQTWPASTGVGSLEAARGSWHLSAGDAVLTGENDLFGPFNTAAWAKASSAGTAWVGGTWMGRRLTGSGWSAASASYPAWSGYTWSGYTWSGYTWSGDSWAGYTWSGYTWSGYTWSGYTWSGYTWSGYTWSGDVWAADVWGD